MTARWTTNGYLLVEAGTQPEDERHREWFAVRGDVMDHVYQPGRHTSARAQPAAWTALDADDAILAARWNFADERHG
jgi:hypothetical protein